MRLFVERAAILAHQQDAADNAFLADGRIDHRVQRLLKLHNISSRFDGSLAASRGQRLDRETGPAAAGCHRIGVADLERLTNQIIDEIDLRTAHEFQAHGIDQHHRVALLQNGVVASGLFLYEIVFILESGASAAGHRNAQHRPFGFLGQDARHALGGAVGQDDLGGSKSGFGHNQFRAVS